MAGCRQLLVLGACILAGLLADLRGWSSVLLRRVQPEDFRPQNMTVWVPSAAHCNAWALLVADEHNGNLLVMEGQEPSLRVVQEAPFRYHHRIGQLCLLSWRCQAHAAVVVNGDSLHLITDNAVHQLVPPPSIRPQTVTYAVTFKLSTTACHVLRPDPETLDRGQRQSALSLTEAIWHFPQRVLRVLVRRGGTYVIQKHALLAATRPCLCSAAVWQPLQRAGDKGSRIDACQRLNAPRLRFCASEHYFSVLKVVTNITKWFGRQLRYGETPMLGPHC
jgi:hypothetical protein